MDFFQKLSNTLSNTGKDIAKKTKDFSDTSKLNHEITRNQDIINRTYSQIGQIYFNNYSSLDCPELKELCNSITEANSKIDSLKKEINLIKGFSSCPQCNNVVAIGATFCGNCGAKLKSEVAETVATPNDEVVSTSTTVSTDTIISNPVVENATNTDTTENPTTQA